MAEGAEGGEVVKGAEGEGAIGVDWDMGAEWAEGDEGVAICIVLDGYDTMGIGYIALLGFGAKCWLDGVDGLSGYPLDCYNY